MDPFNFDNERPDASDLGLSPMVQALTRPSAPPTVKKHGTGILSLLGDYLMDATGLGEIRDKHELSNILQTPGLAPDEVVRRVAAVNPDAAIKLQNQYTDNARLQAVADTNNEYKEGRLADVKMRRAEAGKATAKRFINSLLSSSGDDTARKATYDRLRPYLLQNYPDNDYSNLSAALPEQYDPTILKAFADSDSTVNQQNGQAIHQDQLDHKIEYDDRRLGQYDRGLDQRDVRLGQTGEMLDIARQRANAYITNSGKAAGRARPIMRYPGDDGYYHVQFDDGSEVTSNVKVRPTGKGSLLSKFTSGGGGAEGAPPPRRAGDKIRGPGGKIFVSPDGKTWKPSN